MTVVDDTLGEKRPFAADVAKLLHIMVHCLYADKNIFLRELISNAADACERLRYEAIAHPELLGEECDARITLLIDAESNRLTVSDNGIGMSREEMEDGLGTIARSGTRALMERIESAESQDAPILIGQFGVGFYSAFMVADHVEVISRRAGTDEAWQWSSDGRGTYSIAPVPVSAGPRLGTDVILHLRKEASSLTERPALERLVKAQSGHVPIPIWVAESPGAEVATITDGTALWTKPRSSITDKDYAEFYRSITGLFDEPALTIHFRAEGRQEYIALVFIPGSRPFDLFEPERRGRMSLYVKRVLITDDTEIIPRYLRFARGLVDSLDLPLNVSRETIQKSQMLSTIGKGVTKRILSHLDQLTEKQPEAFLAFWENFGAVLKEGIYDDFERRDALLALCRFKTSASNGAWRSLKDYVGALRENQTAIYYIVGDDSARLQTSPHLEGFRARGVEVLLLSDPVDSFWVTSGAGFEGKPLKSVTQGTADLELIPRLVVEPEPVTKTDTSIHSFIAFMKETLGEAVLDVRLSMRLTDSLVCLVAPEFGPDRQLQKLLTGAGRPMAGLKPILEVNPHHPVLTKLASLPDEQENFKRDAAHLLLDVARVLDGDGPLNVSMFSDRLVQLLGRSVPNV